MSLLDDELGDDPGPSSGWQPRPWQLWSSALLVGGAILLAWAGRRLAAGDLGTSLRPRGCDGDVLVAVGLLGIGALCMLTGMALARLQHPGALLAWDARTLPWTLPLPVLLLAGTLPGVAGCTQSRSLDDLALLGDALVGASGIVLAGAAVTLVAAALAATASVSWLAPDVAQPDDPPGIVELAMQEAEAIHSDEAARRFRGVDD